MITELLNLELTAILLVRRKKTQNYQARPHQNTLCHSEREEIQYYQEGVSAFGIYRHKNFFLLLTSTLLFIYFYHQSTKQQHIFLKNNANGQS